MLAAVVAVVVLLRGVLLPFVAGMVLAYVLNPIASRMERLGVNRLLATIAIIVVAVVTIAVLMVLTVPMIVGEISYFIESLPLYVRRLQTLATDPSRPWLSKIVGEGLGEAERSFGELTSLASSWLGALLRSIWSGGQALISIVSLTVVAPIVACYLIYDWNRMIAAIDHWVPPVYRETVRMLASEIDDTIRGFARGQSLLCLVLAVFYASALSLIGLKHGVLIGIASGLLSFIPYLGALAGLAIATCVAISQFWPDWTMVFFVLAVFFVGRITRGLCPGAVSGRPKCAFEPRLDDICAVRLRLSVRLRRSLDCGAACCCHRRADPFRTASVLCKPAVRWPWPGRLLARDRRIECSCRRASTQRGA